MTNSLKTSEVTPTLAASIALLVAVFAAVGVAGDVLVRAVRNDPWLISFVVAVLILAVSIPFFYAVKGLVLRGSVALLAVTLIAAVFVGTISVSDREQPRLVLSAESAGEIVTIGLDATAAGLRTEDSLLVQIVGVRSELPFGASRDLCEQSQMDRQMDPARGDLLLWERSGPDARGNVAKLIKLQINSGVYSAVCAWAALPERSRDNLSDDRRVSAYVRLVGQPPAAAVASTP